MANDRKNEDQPELHYEKGIPILPGEPEREKHARHAEQKEEREFKKNQTSIQQWILLVQIVLALLAVIGSGISFYQARIAKESADAAKQSSEATTNQVWQAVGNINWLARSMDWSQKVSQRGIEDSSSQAQKSFHISQELANEAKIANFNAELALEVQTRPWIGVEGIPKNIHNGIDGVTFEVTLRNYGRSPAMVAQPTFVIGVLTKPEFRFWKRDIPKINLCDFERMPEPNADEFTPRIVHPIFPDQPYPLTVYAPSLDKPNAFRPSRFTNLSGCIVYNVSSKGFYGTRLIYDIRYPSDQGKLPEIVLSSIETFEWKAGMPKP